MERIIHITSFPANNNAMRHVKMRLLRQDWGVHFSQPCSTHGCLKYAVLQFPTAIIERALSSSLCSEIGRNGRTHLIHYDLELAGPEYAQQIHDHPTRHPHLLFSHSSYTVTIGRRFHRSTIKSGANEDHSLWGSSHSCPFRRRQRWTITMTGTAGPEAL